jgi:hypothetical protein
MKRAVEMYIGFGSDFGTWSTEYVEIPRDTPDDDIERVAVEQAKIDFGGGDGFVFTDLYAIPTLEDSDETMEYNL